MSILEVVFSETEDHLSLRKKSQSITPTRAPP
jgi:hypothetical protein